ncbi:hypothetical protein TNCV_1033661 [Trichonephila clavipes]|nr:hypothetical protein TNCV_1033661 [Trichonephila clavipes]
MYVCNVFCHASAKSASLCRSHYAVYIHKCTLKYYKVSSSDFARQPMAVRKTPPHRQALNQSVMRGVRDDRLAPNVWRDSPF